MTARPARLAFVIGGVRSGTTVLRSMLGSHRAIRDRGEVFNVADNRQFHAYWLRRIARDPTWIYPERLEHLFAAFAKANVRTGTCTILDIKYEHLLAISRAWQTLFSTPLVLDYALANRIPIIHVRRNALHSTISNELAIATGRYHLFAGDRTRWDSPSLALSVDRVAWQVEVREKTMKYVDDLIPARQRLSVSYESLFDRRGEFRAPMCRAVAKLLGVTARFDRRPVYRKVIERPLSEMVSNFDEIAARFPGLV